MKTKFLTTIGTKLGKTGLVLKKHESEILMVLGAAGAVTSTVLACRATLKVHDVLNDSKDALDLIEQTSTREDLSEEYTELDAKNDRKIVYVQTGVKIVKTYAPSVILGGLSLAAMFASNNVLKKRSAALAAAYFTVDQSFKEYRGRVSERFGDDVEQEIRLGLKEQTITEKVMDEETGKEKKVKKKIKVSDPNLKSDYAMYYNKQTSAYADSNYEYNLCTLRAAENYWTTALQSRKYVTLNEVLDYLGISGTKAGMVVGWYYDPNDPNCETYIDLRIQEVYLDNGDGTFEKTIVIDPNVQGSIYELMED